jgi:dTDP-4-dehydrorhamnose 3,5-epimerase-like enzyme
VLAELTSHGDPASGYLSFLNIGDLEFVPRRIFYVTGVSAGSVRGGHGHYEDKQYLICLRGSVRVTLVSKDKKITHYLKPNDYCLMDQMTWGEQEYLTGDEILLVLCSTEFNKEDYFYDVETVCGVQ